MENKLLKTLVAVTTFTSIFTTALSQVAISSTGSSNGNFGLELHYLNSAFQCGSDSTQADIKVYVYDQDDNLLTTMSKGDTYLSTEIDSVHNLAFEYKIYNLSCISEGSWWSAADTQLLGSNDTVPDFNGFSGQDSIQQMLSGLDSYEELYLAELGTSNTSSSAYDLQDVVLIVDNDPNAAPGAYSDSAETNVGESVIIDVLANDVDPENGNLTISDVNNVFGGTAQIEDNKIIYTASLIPGTYSLNYTIEDDQHATGTGTVTIKVMGYPD